MQPFIGIILGFVLILTRVSAFFVVLPVFGSDIAPVRIKAAAAILISLFFSFIIAPPVQAASITTLQACLLVAGEAVYGLSLGLVAHFLFSAVRLGGRFIEQQMGFDISQIVDPITGEPGDPLSLLIEMIFIVLFLCANGHHLLFITIGKSFQTFAPGTMPQIGILCEAVTKAGSIMFIAALRIAAPMLAAFLLILIIIAVLARVVPDMDILFTSFPLRVGFGFLITAMFLPLIASFISEFANWMSKLLPI